ncbi:MAG: hypothetical protein H6Q68_2137 [Firmicutes bacterium]|nr:hypothetical protein [Bacillota bacterium]
MIEKVRIQLHKLSLFIGGNQFICRLCENKVTVTRVGGNQEDYCYGQVMEKN